MATRDDMQTWRDGLKERKKFLESELKGVNDAIAGLDLALESSGPGVPEPGTSGKKGRTVIQLLDEIDANDYLHQKAGVLAVRHVMSHHAVAMSKLLTVVRGSGYKMNREQLNGVLLRLTKMGIPIRSEGKGKHRVFMMKNGG